MNILSISSILAVVALSLIILVSTITTTTTNIYAQQQEELEINQNSLVACVDYHLNKIEERGDNTVFKETSTKTILTIVCNLGYEHTGKYTHLLPEDVLNKYIEMAAIKAYLEKIPID